MERKNIVVLSGAGISAESGISTFRDSDGLWENHRVEDVATIDAWWRNRKLVLDFYNERRAQLEKCKPNQAHLLVAALQDTFNVTVVTQNVDNLHERAGSKIVIHLHGELTKARGENDDYYNNFEIGYKKLNLGDKSKSGGQLRPHIVWFGEQVPELDRAIEAVGKADILIVIGTSLVVYPAAGLVNCTKRGCKIYLVDPKDVETRIDCEHIKEKATIGMKILFEKLNNNNK